MSSAGSNATLATSQVLEDPEDSSSLQVEDPTQLHSNFHIAPPPSETSGNPSDATPFAGVYAGMDLGQDELHLPDLSWDNDAFLFSDFIPSQFLDTDIPLGDLFQQAPAQKESEIQMSVSSGSVLLPKTPGGRSSLSHDELHDNLNLKHPPRFPSMDDQPDHSNLDTRSDIVNCPWAVTPSGHKTIVNKITAFNADLLHIVPSKCAFVRYLEGYFRKFHSHLPFLHVASFRPENVGVELILSMIAIGAFYCFEHAEGYRLYGAARLSIDSILKSLRESLVSHLAVQTSRPLAEGGMVDSSISSHGSLYSTETLQHNAPSINKEDSQVQLERAQALIILTVIGTWGDKSLLQDSLAMSGQLVYLARKLGINYPDDASNANLEWLDWVAHEQLRRTLSVAYIVLNLNSIISDVAPMILTHEVSLCLPSCEAEWGAASSAAWRRHRDVSALRERPFVQTLDCLFIGQSICDEWGVSAFSNYLLIHGIIQKIHLEIQTTNYSRGAPSARHELLKIFETALRLWQQSWETTWESTLDPNSPKGPIGFNATALLRLAYIRLNIRVGICHKFVTSDTLQIKELFSGLRGISLSRNPPLDRAILQCIHALSIPVRVGIQNVARTHVLHWGIQHSICHLECALLLTIWLQNIAESVHVGGVASLRGDEIKLLTMAKGIVKETSLHRRVNQQTETRESIRCLAGSVARLWAEISSGPHIFDIVHRIGICLCIISDVLESENLVV